MTERTIAFRLINDKVGLENKCITIYTDGRIEGLEEGWTVIDYMPKILAEAEINLNRIKDVLHRLTVETE